MSSLVEDKENSFDASQDAYVPNFTTSKDTIHILRLSAILHVLHLHVNPILGGDILDDDVASEIPMKRVTQAKALYNILIQQKALFVQVCTHSLFFKF